MAPKNMDKTIQKLLFAYAARCKRIMDKDRKHIEKQHFPTQKDRTDAVQKLTRVERAYEFLLEIAENPKKYLYSGKDLIYAEGDLFNKLSPILSTRFDKSQKHLLVRLSEKIAYHVNYEQRYNDHNGVWVYSGTPNSDLNAEAILQMNKIVQLWNANDFVGTIKSFAPASAFAVDAYHKESR